MRLDIIKFLIKSNFLKYLMTCIISIFIGFFLINVVYMIPTDAIKHNVSKSVTATSIEDLHPQLVNGYINTTLDLYTDSLMLNIAVNKSNERFYKASMNNDFAIYNDGDQSQNLVNYVQDKEGYHSNSYQRYWHGYLVLLKPLLLIFNVQDISILNFTVQLVLFCFLLYFISKSNGLLTAIAFAIAFSFIGFPLVTGISFQYTSIILISIISSIILLYKKEWFLQDKIRVNSMFLIIGMLTSYMDLLTFPTLTLTLPLLLLILNLDVRGKEKVIYIIKLSLLWGFGYGVMWASKWLIASLILNQNVFKNAFETIAFRTSSNISFEAQEKYSRFFALKKTVFDVYFRKPILLITLSFIIYTIQKSLRRMNLKNYLHVVKENLSMLLIAVIPVVFIFLSANHSIIHSYFTNKQLLPSIVVLLLLFNDNKIMPKVIK